MLVKMRALVAADRAGVRHGIGACSCAVHAVQEQKVHVSWLRAVASFRIW